MNVEKIEMSKLNPAKYNPRKDLKPEDAEYKKLKRSLEQFGYIEPIVWNKRTGNIISGHQRYKILKDMNRKEADCVVVDFDDKNEKALNLALNKIRGQWDEDKLSMLINELDTDAFDVSITGFDETEIEELLNSFYSKESVQDDFDVASEKEEIEKSGKTLTQKGDIWILGNHRLMCGDTTKESDFKILMDGKRAQCTVTSPPYGVGKEYEKAGIEPWFKTVKPAIDNICKYTDVVCWNIIDLFATGSQFIEPTEAYSIKMFADNKFRPLWIRIWKKQGINFGLAPYHLVSNKPAQQYEYITAFAENEVEEYNDQEYRWVSAFASHSYKFVKRLSRDERKKWGYAGIWEIATVKANKEHPAMFPVELPWRCIKMHSDINGIVLEPFGGCGTTLIACEQTKRKCYAMEISPIYCDLIIKRWEQFTGKKAKKLS